MAATHARDIDEILPRRTSIGHLSNGSAALVPDYSSMRDHTDKGTISLELVELDNHHHHGEQRSGNEQNSQRKTLRHFCYKLQKAKCHEHIVYFCALSVASYIGVLTRIYLSHLVEWNGVPLFPSLYAEIVGTAIMGFIGSHKMILSNYKATYQAIATGLCGSITAFSSWNFEAVSILFLDQPEISNATRVIGWGTTVLLGLGMPSAALLFGRHVAGFLSPWSDDNRLQSERKEGMQVEQSQPWRTCYTQLFERIGYVISWIICTVIVVVLSYKYNRMDLMFSILFASLGTYIRWHLAPFNAACADFKLGTFVVNVLGAWLLGGATVTKSYFMNSNAHNSDHLLLSVLAGIATGFCGCLTTVSTFAVELNSLSLRGTYVYACCSIAAAQIGLIIIRGTYEWTK